MASSSRKKKVNMCSLQSIFQNSKQRKQKKTFKFNFIKMKGKIDFWPHYQIYRFQGTNIQFCEYFFFLSHICKIVNPFWRYNDWFCCCFIGFFLKQNPNLALKTKVSSKHTTNPSFKDHLHFSFVLTESDFPNYASCWKIVAQGWHPVFKESLLAYLE